MNRDGMEYDASQGMSQEEATRILMGDAPDIWSLDPFACVEIAADEAWRDEPIAWSVTA